MKKTREVILEQQAINRKLWAKENGRMHHVDANKLIAEFMGHKLGLDGDGMGEQQCRIFEKGLGTKRIEDTYSKSWDWLMPVVEKCYDNGADENEVGDITHALLDCDIDHTYRAVVEFIEDYNKGEKCNNCKGITLYPDEQCAVCNRLG